MQSALYTGTLRHRRFEPVPHGFRYRLFMAFLDIDRIAELMTISRFTSYNHFNWAAFAERDHFGNPALPLRERVLASANANGITLSEGPIFLLTHLRYLGYTFNPISLFYCYDKQGVVQAVLAEVNSTFGESHNYWLPAPGNGPFICPKLMHVSPFMKMQLDYSFALTSPCETLVAHMKTLDKGHSFFDATLSLNRQPWNARTLHRALLAHPWMTLKVIAAIHWQALLLYLKKVPVFKHVPIR